MLELLVVDERNTLPPEAAEGVSGSPSVLHLFMDCRRLAETPGSIGLRIEGPGNPTVVRPREARRT